MTAEAYMWV